MPGEEENDPDFAAALAKVGDIYVNDAFSAAHRAHASTEGVAHLLPAYAGRAMQEELEALDKALGNPQPPGLAIVGGAKISTKLELLANLIRKVDALVIGGGMANTFLAAKGVEIGKSLSEPDLSARRGRSCSRRRMPERDRAAGRRGRRVRVQGECAARDRDARPRARRRDDPRCRREDRRRRSTAGSTRRKTLVWNGPLGVFEMEPFDRATVAAAQHAAQRTREGKLLSVAGGGDTVAALNHAGAADDFTYVSTAGGAFLEWLEGKPLPGVEALRSGRS